MICDYCGLEKQYDLCDGCGSSVTSRKNLKPQFNTPGMGVPYDHLPQDVKKNITPEQYNKRRDEYIDDWRDRLSSAEELDV